MLLALCLLIVFNVAFTQSPSYLPPVFLDSEREAKIVSTRTVVDKLFKDYWEKQHLPGLVYGIVLDRKLVYSGGFGYSNLEKKYAADASSMFRIASMSKSFTALAILRLRDGGKLNLDDPASKYIPEMRNMKYLSTDAPEITIRHLLTHGAGFPEDNPWGDRQLADSDAELRKLMADGPSFSNVPGTKYEYSNVGFALLGQIVQVVSGTSFKDYMKDHVFKPLGMKNTVFEFDVIPERRLALGYNWIRGEYVNIPLLHHGSYGAMGGIITSIEEFSQYVSLHLSAWPARSDPESGPLKRSSLREMHHPWRFEGMDTRFKFPSGRECAMATAYGYGLGWSSDCQGRVMIGHGGGLPGFGSNWRMMPEYGLAVISFDNRTYGGTSGVNIGVLDTILALTHLQPMRLSPSEILKKRQKELFVLLPDWTGAEESGLFAENFFLDNPIDDLRQRTKTVFEKAGKIVGTREIVPENQLRGVFTLEGEKTNVAVFFTLTPEPNPLIQQVRIRNVDKEE